MMASGSWKFPSLDDLNEEIKERVSIHSSNNNKNNNLSKSRRPSSEVLEHAKSLVKKIDKNVQTVYNDTFVGAGSEIPLGDNCLLACWAWDLLQGLLMEKEEKDQESEVQICLADLHLRFGWSLAALAQSIACGIEMPNEIKPTLEAFGLEDAVVGFQVGEQMLQTASSIFENLPSSVVPEKYVGLCDAVLGELYYCFHSQKINDEDFRVPGMESKTTLDSIRLAEQGIKARVDAGLERTSETATMYKDLGKYYSFTEEILLDGCLEEEVDITPEQAHEFAATYMNQSAEIHRMVGCSASTAANVFRLMDSGGIKIRETAEKRAKRVIYRAAEIEKEMEMCQHMEATFGQVLNTEAFLEQLTGGQLDRGESNNKGARIVSNDLLAYGFYTNQERMQEEILKVLKRVLKPPIHKSDWTEFQSGLLASNIWFQRDEIQGKFFF